MIKKLPKVTLHRKPPKAQPELTNTYKIYAWIWLVLSLNWVAWVVQASLTSKAADGGISLAFALPGMLVAGLAIWLLKCRPDRRRTAITAIGGTTTLFFIANLLVAFLCIVTMALALRPRKP